MRLYHLDLKTTMYKAEYLRKWFAKLKDNCYDGVVIEVDNKLIYPSHPGFAAHDALSSEQWNDLVRYGRSLGLTIYPLLQTLGHMEHILASDTTYSHLAENPGNPYMLCPSKEGSLNLIRDLIDDLNDIFDNPPFIHLGGDEVFGHMGSKGVVKCARCSKEDPSAILLKYLLALADHCLEKNIRPEFWADEILTYPEILEMFPPETRFVDWLYTRTEEYSPRITHLWGARHLNNRPSEEDISGELPENLKVLLPFMFNEQGEFDNFYGVKFIRSKGYDVCVGSGVRFYGDTFELPRIQIGMGNVAVSEKIAVDTGSCHLVTSWAVRYSHPEATWPSLSVVECLKKTDPSLKPLGNITGRMDLIEEVTDGFFGIDIPTESFARFERPYYDIYMKTVYDIVNSKEKEDTSDKLKRRISACESLLHLLEKTKDGDPDCIRHWILGVRIALLRSLGLKLMVESYGRDIDRDEVQKLIDSNLEAMALFEDIYRESVTEFSLAEEREIKFNRDIRILKNLLEQ